jgi:leucyl-tRNA synthetase
MTEQNCSEPRGLRPGYPAREIEGRWQRRWQEQGAFRTNPDPKRKFYVLVMFFYPSGDVHMGHCRNYVIGDVLARFRRMQGYDVLHPFGWDAFGLPAENAAIAHGNHPSYWTFESIKTARRSLQLLGISYDWDREVTTCLPEYYRWNQWLFLRFYERGLAYRKEALVNWCPNCQTVLANEQVDDGVCYRCKAVVGKRKLTQWFLKITDYAQALLDGVGELVDWPENVRTMQRNWIGRSDGVEVDFRLEGSGDKVPVFTTRPDTLWGVTFMALAPDAPLAEKVAQGTGREKEVEEFRRRVLMRPEIERIAATGDKEGVFTGRYAVNPVNGARVPIYLADFVLASYGTGMVMAVPAHDQRDFEFARKYDIPIKVVIQPIGDGGVRLDASSMSSAFTDVGMMADSGPFDGTRSDEGVGRVTAYLAEKGLGRSVVNYRLKDWLISRQRYWGTPIPMVHCERCGVVPVPDKDLPVLLPPEVNDYKPKGKSVLEGVDEFINTTCPKCGGPARRDPDTMDTFFDSSWYFLRYTDAHNERLPFARERADRWLPIDEYIGGIEHATGHLIFFRFFTRVLADLGMVAVREPARVLHTQGMVSLNGVTMSSSKRVGIWVGPFVEERGADTARLTILFAAPPEKPMDWTEDLVTGVTRFLSRVWRLFEDHRPDVNFDQPDTGRFGAAERDLYIRLNQTVAKVIVDIDAFQYNTAIAAQMEFVNQLYAFADRSRNSTPGHQDPVPSIQNPEPKTQSPETAGGERSAVFGFCLGRLIFLLAPFAPHLAEELWHLVRPGAGSIFDERFPEPDRQFLVFDEITVPVQVDGKLRGRVTVPRAAPESDVKEKALADDDVKRNTAGRVVVKVIYVPGRMVNIVTRGG